MSNELAIGIFIFVVTIVAIWMLILGRAIEKIEDRSKRLTEMQGSITETLQKKTMSAILWGMPKKLVSTSETQYAL